MTAATRLSLKCGRDPNLKTSFKYILNETAVDYKFLKIFWNAVEEMTSQGIYKQLSNSFVSKYFSYQPFFKNESLNLSLNFAILGQNHFDWPRVFENTVNKLEMWFEDTRSFAFCSPQARRVNKVRLFIRNN